MPGKHYTPAKRRKSKKAGHLEYAASVVVGLHVILLLVELELEGLLALFPSADIRRFRVDDGNTTTTNVGT